MIVLLKKDFSGEHSLVITEGMKMLQGMAVAIKRIYKNGKSNVSFTAVEDPIGYYYPEELIERIVEW